MDGMNENIDEKEEDESEETNGRNLRLLSMSNKMLKSTNSELNRGFIADSEFDLESLDDHANWS